VNWKASLLGAFVVAIAGLAVGVAVGGKSTTKVRTVTVHAAAVVSATTSTSTSSSETSTTPGSLTTTESEGTTPNAEGGAPQQFLADYLASQGGGEKLNQDGSSASLDGSPEQQQLQGKTYQNAVVFDIDNYGGNTASFQLPTPGFTRLISKAVGLQTTADADVYYHLAVYKNNDNSPKSVVLYTANFRGPSEVHKMDFAIQGATDLLFVWTKSSSEPDGSDSFIMADPVLVGGS